MPGVVRLSSYLSPGLPEGLFQDIAGGLTDRLGARVHLDFDGTGSGPRSDALDPMAGIDLAFVCAPSYVDLRTRGHARLVGVAPVFADPRNEGRPVYHSEVVVSERGVASRLGDLEDSLWAVNDDRSLSGYGCVVRALGHDAKSVWSGGHLASIRMVRRGDADAAAIDANVLARVDSSDLRVVHTFGPHPVQPIIASAGFEHAGAIASALLGLSLPRWGLPAFRQVTDLDYPDSLSL